MILPRVLTEFDLVTRWLVSQMLTLWKAFANNNTLILNFYTLLSLTVLIYASGTDPASYSNVTVIQAHEMPHRIFHQSLPFSLAIIIN